VELFAESAADLFSNVTKPLLDVCIYVHSLARRVDPLAPYSMIAYLLTSGVALTAMRKPTGAYTAAVQHQVSTAYCNPTATRKGIIVHAVKLPLSIKLYAKVYYSTA
jgi:ABC transporter transmembrane region 2